MGAWNARRTVEPLNPPVPLVPGARKTGAPGTRIALVDSGVNYLLPEIASRLARDAHGGLVGFDFWDLDTRPFDANPARSAFHPQRHGTRTASLILEEAPVAALVPYRYPRHHMTRMAALVEHAVSAGVRVMNISMGSRRRHEWADFERAARGPSRRCCSWRPLATTASISTRRRSILRPCRSTTCSPSPLRTPPGFPRPARTGEPRASTSRCRGSGSLSPASTAGRAKSRGRAMPRRGSPRSRHVCSPRAPNRPRPGSSPRSCPGRKRRRARNRHTWGRACCGIPSRRIAAAATRSGAIRSRYGSGHGVPEDLYPEGARPARARGIALDVVILDDSGWRIPEILRATARAAQILAQCDVSVDRAALRIVEAPRRYRHLHDVWSPRLVQRLDPVRPAVFFVDDTLPRDALRGRGVRPRELRTFPRDAGHGVDYPGRDRGRGRHGSRALSTCSRTPVGTKAIPTTSCTKQPTAPTPGSRTGSASACAEPRVASPRTFRDVAPTGQLERVTDVSAGIGTVSSRAVPAFAFHETPEETGSPRGRLARTFPYTPQTLIVRPCRHSSRRKSFSSHDFVSLRSKTTRWPARLAQRSSCSPWSGPALHGSSAPGSLCITLHSTTKRSSAGSEPRASPFAWPDDQQVRAPSAQSILPARCARRCSPPAWRNACSRSCGPASV